MRKKKTSERERKRQEIYTHKNFFLILVFKSWTSTFGFAQPMAKFSIWQAHNHSRIERFLAFKTPTGTKRKNNR